MEWSRLQRGYQADEKIVALRLAHGYIGEVFHTRFVALGREIKAPESVEFEVLAQALGFALEEVDKLQRIALMSLDLSLCVRRKTTGTTVHWDLARRRKYLPPKSGTRDYEREKKRRQRAVSVPEVSPGQVPEVSPGDMSPMSRPTYERTNVRTYDTNEEPSGTDSMAALDATPDDEPPLDQEPGQDPTALDAIIPAVLGAIETGAGLNGQLPAELEDALENRDWIHMYLPICRAAPAFATVAPGQIRRLRQELPGKLFGDLLVALRLSTPIDVDSPGAYLDAIAERLKTENADWIAKHQPETEALDA